jgi:hypothetical protein
MNDYANGALEALAWALNLLDQTDDVGRVRRQLEGARDDLLARVSVNFRQKLRPRQSLHWQLGQLAGSPANSIIEEEAQRAQ